MSKFWIEDYERDHGDLVLFVSCFGANRARFIAHALHDVENVKVIETEFVEVVIQESDHEGGLTHDDHYIVSVRVPGGAESDDVLDREHDRVHDLIERAFSHAR